MKITVIVATHKKYRMPHEKCYLPLHVGRQLGRDIGFAGMIQERVFHGKILTIVS